MWTGHFIRMDVQRNRLLINWLLKVNIHHMPCLQSVLNSEKYPQTKSQNYHFLDREMKNVNDNNNIRSHLTSPFTNVTEHTDNTYQSLFHHIT